MPSFRVFSLAVALALLTSATPASISAENRGRGPSFKPIAPQVAIHNNGAAASSMATVNLGRPTGLLCNFRKSPAIGVTATPTFSWIVPPCASGECLPLFCCS